MRARLDAALRRLWPPARGAGAAGGTPSAGDAREQAAAGRNSSRHHHGADRGTRAHGARDDRAEHTHHRQQQQHPNTTSSQPPPLSERQRIPNFLLRGVKVPPPSYIAADLQERKRYLREHFTRYLDSLASDTGCSHESGPTCMLAKRRNERLRAAMERLYELQNPADCSAARFYLWTGSRFGLGSELNVLVDLLVKAVLSDRVLLVWGVTPYVTRRDLCPERILDCYLMPLSHCMLHDLRADMDIVFGSHRSAYLDRSKVANAGVSRNYRRAAYEKLGLVDEEDMGEYAYAKVFSRYVFRLNERTERQASHFAAELGLVDRSYVSVHIRHGDKQEGARIPETEWAAITRRAMGLTGLRRVFVSSDNVSIADTLRPLMPRATEVVSVPSEYFVDTGTREASHELLRGHVGDVQHDQGLVMMASIALMARGAYVIGALSSNIDRVVYAQMPAGNSLLPPFYDVDGDAFYLGGFRFANHIGQVCRDQGRCKWNRL